MGGDASIETETEPVDCAWLNHGCKGDVECCPDFVCRVLEDESYNPMSQTWEQIAYCVDDGSSTIAPSMSLNDSLFYIFGAFLLILVAVNAWCCCMSMAPRRNNKSYDAVQLHDGEDRSEDQKELL